MSFKENVKRSFTRARTDVESLRYSQAMLQRSMNDWTQHLVQENKELRKRIDELEARQRSIEAQSHSRFY